MVRIFKVVLFVLDNHSSENQKNDGVQKRRFGVKHREMMISSITRDTSYTPYTSYTLIFTLRRFLLHIHSATPRDG
eukprot:SAG31_NODE_1145_length_9684_cov_12.800209_7_plen_76_part_00